VEYALQYPGIFLIVVGYVSLMFLITLPFWYDERKR